MPDELTVSVSILTYNRAIELEKLLISIAEILEHLKEVIVVDNNSSDETSSIINKFKFVKYIKLHRNIGTGARNYGIKSATSDILIMLDDDVHGITYNEIVFLKELFRTRPKLAAVCFKVLNYNDKTLMNWCHMHDPSLYKNKEFLTSEITEGAVAFRRKIFEEVGFYCEEYFISNEGSDLACRIIDKKYDIIYSPQIVVLHNHSQTARKPWRRYYYDSRNHIIFAIRNYRILFGIRYIIVKLAVTFIYALRDGYLIYWFKGILSGFLKVPFALKTRNTISKDTEIRLKSILKYRPPFYHLLKKRLFNKAFDLR